MVLPKWRTVFVVNPKAACTSLLWLVAALQGEDLDGFQHSRKPNVSRSLTVHDWDRWAHTPVVGELSDAQLAEIEPDRGWFIFALSRHPLSRLWSAWMSKLLMREPIYAAGCESFDWFPRRPETWDGIVEDFRRFVNALRGNPDLARLDIHWMPQSELLNIGQTRYTHIGKLEDNAPTLELWKAHLRSQGWTEDFELPHTNRGLLRLLPGSLGEETLAAVRVIYSKDYELFGYADAPPATADLSGASPRPDQNVQVAPETLAAMREIIDRHERIADLQQMLCGALEAAAVAQTDLAKSVHRQGDLERRLFEQTIAARDFRIELARAARKTA